MRVDDIQCEEYRTLKYPPDLQDCFRLRLVSNGLVCLFDYAETSDKAILHLWNPVIQKYKTLPPPPLPPSNYSCFWSHAIAFGFVQEINDYVVVCISLHLLKKKKKKKQPPSSTNYSMTRVYSLSTDSWKNITHDHHHSSTDFVRIRLNDPSVFVNGVAIWSGVNKRQQGALMCFDTKTEMMRQILLPEWVGDGSLDSLVIHAFGQSIAYFDEVDDNYPCSGGQLGVWVLKGDPMNEYLWEKKMIVELHQPVIPRVMGVRNNGEPILSKSYDLISYNLHTRESYDFVKPWNSFPPHWDDYDCDSPCEITPFEESLGLLDVDCTQY